MSELSRAEESVPEAPAPEERRSLLARLSNVAVFASLAAAYGTLAAMCVRFLFPARPPAKGWMYVTRADTLGRGDSLLFRTPGGSSVNVARQGEGMDAADFVALSSTCPHLGCQVHWEPQNDRYFCPCHNGVFSPDGTGIGGPPGDAGQSLPQYALKVDTGLLYLEVDLEQLAMGPGEIVEPYQGPRGPGHDPCLGPRAAGCGCAGAEARA